MRVHAQRPMVNFFVGFCILGEAVKGSSTRREELGTVPKHYSIKRCSYVFCWFRKPAGVSGRFKRVH